MEFVIRAHAQIMQKMNQKKNEKKNFPNGHFEPGAAGTLQVSSVHLI